MARRASPISSRQAQSLGAVLGDRYLEIARDHMGKVSRPKLRAGRVKLWKESTTSISTTTATPPWQERSTSTAHRNHTLAGAVDHHHLLLLLRSRSLSNITCELGIGNPPPPRVTTGESEDGPTHRLPHQPRRLRRRRAHRLLQDRRHVPPRGRAGRGVGMGRAPAQMGPRGMSRDFCASAPPARCCSCVKRWGREVV